MAEFLRELFVKPIPITGIGRLVMLVPLALSVSIVYKTIRCKRLRTIPTASVTMCLAIVFFMMLIGVSLLVFFNLFA
jgi:hypothetical protein